MSYWWIIILIASMCLFLKNYLKRNKNDYKELLDEGAIIVDVRTEDEYKTGHIKNSINIPLKDLIYRISEFNKGDNIVTVCAVGIRAESAKKYFESKGYRVANGGRWTNLKDYS